MDIVSSLPKIEGIGHEVILTGSVAFILLVFLAYLVHRQISSNGSQAIHPSSEEAVNNARTQLIAYSNRFLADADSNGPGDGDNGDLGPDSLTGSFVNVNHYGMDSVCPVCLNEAARPVETNCGHLFCGRCLVVYWRHGGWLGPVPCPVCRQQVSLILQCFRYAPQNLSEQEQTEVQSLIRDINDYNRRFSGEPRPWLDYIYDLPTLLRHITSEFFSLGGLMYMFRIRIVLCFIGAIMYLISPLDMIPEAVFGLFGLLDDVFVVLLLAIYVTIIYRRFLASRWEDVDT